MKGLNQNLLSKTLRIYILVAVVILLIIAPIFYQATLRLYLHETDEILVLHKKEFIHFHQPYLREADISQWNKYNRDEKIEPAKQKHKRDKFSIQYFYDTLKRKREPYRVLRTSVSIEGKGYSYSVKINLIEKEETMKSIVYLFLVLTVSLLVGLYFITRLISAKLWKPFYGSLAVLEKFEVDKMPNANHPHTNTVEFVRQNAAIENLINKNISIYNRQREFVENAAHELQTPLAVIQGKIETLYQQSNLTKEQSEGLEKINSSVTRLIRLNKNLLLLSRIDRDQFPQSENIFINELIQKNMEFFTEQAQSKQIEIKVNSEVLIHVNANLALTEILISNLFLNSIKHNTPNGFVLITITEECFSFSNPGLSEPLPSERIFERFTKIDPSSQGTGLGLAIIKKIAELHGWSAVYQFENKIHTFSIRF
ncbi:MAG: HAMP domain-containing histidine kinase [Bacteroidetes bacterium]|nr:HAMP domain-containing histidine kinase [Bacteroidota bacterium]